MDGATATDPGETIAEAEAAFASGEHSTAERLLTTLIESRLVPDAYRAEAESDLAVLALSRGRAETAETHLLRALARVPDYPPALENLSALCRAAGDLTEATHWARRLTTVEPASRDAWTALVGLLHERRRHREADATRDRALAGGVELGPGGASPRLLPATIRPIPVAPARVLVLVENFHPSVGGSERLAEAAGAALCSEGFVVGVATRAHPERRAASHRGMLVHEIAREPASELRSIIAEHGYDAVVVLADPASWAIPALLSAPEPRPRVLAVPCVNGEIYTKLTYDPAILRRYQELIQRADLIAVSSHSGADARLAAELSLPVVHLPNASEEPAPATAPATTGDGTRTLLMVANLVPEKNHLGLLDHLSRAAGDWRLRLIGSPAAARPDIAAEVRRRAAADPRIEVMGGAPPEQVAAAMQAADLLLLPSLAEATPVVLLEAMSRRLPWIATPACGSAHDHAGGLIVPLGHFAEAISFLLDDRDSRAALGRAGRRHWETSYRWAVIGRRYADLLRGREPQSIEVPADALGATEAIRERFYDRRPATSRVD